jgi:hypothetical protein
MLYAKIQGSEPILLDQTQLTEESKSFEMYWFHLIFDLFLVIALSDDNSSVYVEEIKKRRYTKEFHSFVKSCVATRLESR